MTDIAFLDVETLGLDPAAPIWEFAALRRDADSASHRIEFTIQHDRGTWLDDLDERFRDDYLNRCDSAGAVPEAAAATMIHIITRNAVLIACNPVFDEPRLSALLRRNGIEPAWHYHPLDSSSLMIGFLAGRGFPPHPNAWKSDVLSATVGVDPDDFVRHTAMGDVEWIAAQWDNIMGGAA